MSVVTEHAAVIAGQDATNIHALGLMLAIRAELVAERGEPQPDWPESARVGFFDEVEKRTRAAVQALRAELTAPARPLGPAIARVVLLRAAPRPQRVEPEPAPVVIQARNDEGDESMHNLSIGDEVLFHPFQKPANFDGPGYTATVTAVDDKHVDLAVQLPDGGRPVELEGIRVGAFGTDKPGTCAPLFEPVSAELVGAPRRRRVDEKPHAPARISPPAPKTQAPPRSDVGEKQEVPARVRTAVAAEPVLEVTRTVPKAVVGPAQPSPAQPSPAQPSPGTVLLTCPMCLRKHRGPDRWESRYCSERCEERACARS